MLRFCRDGILRTQITSDGVTYGIPLFEYQGRVPNAFFMCLSDTFEFEDGLTLREFMLNFKPWQDMVGMLACMDYPAYIREIERLPKVMDMSGKTVNPEYANFDHILISCYASITAVPNYEKYDTTVDFLTAFRNAKPLITNKYELDKHWDYMGVLKEPEYDEYSGVINAYGLSFAPLNEIAHLPIIVDDTMKVVDDTMMGGSNKFLSTTEPIFNGNNPHISTIKNNDGSFAFYRLGMNICPTVYECLIRGFLWEVGFDYSPEQRDETKSKIVSRMDDIDNPEKWHTIEESMKILDDIKPTEVQNEIDPQIKYFMDVCGDLITIIK